MAIHFDLNDLQAFRAVAEVNHFRRAAESVHLSQPAFSRRIDKLEQAIGVRLLERSTRRVSLTAVGRDFARKVAQLLDDLDGTLLGLRGLAPTRLGEVSVACVPSTVYYYLSQVIRRYREAYPKIRVRVLDASANEVLAAVVRGEADFGLNFIGSQEPDIDFTTLAEERFVAACRRDHPLARKRRTTWAELAAYDFIAVSKSSGNRLLLDQALAGVAVRPVPVCEAQHVTTMLGLVEAGLGVAVMPAAVAQRFAQLFRIKVLKLDEPWAERDYLLAVRTQEVLPAVVQRFVDALCPAPEFTVPGQLPPGGAKP